MATDRLDEVLDATYECLARYGVRRTTVDDIGATMGVSRSAVYQYVRGKDDAVRRLAERLHDQALACARAAASADAPAAERIRGVLAAKLELVLRLRGDSPHAAELLDAKARLFGDVCATFTGDLRGLLIELFDTAGTAGSVPPAAAADICVALVIGLESVANPRDLFDPAIDAVLAGLLGTGPSAGFTRDGFGAPIEAFPGMMRGAGA
ncbi:TetR/AcrR family transcriptional regulator [Nocardia xishanensis]|uniref:TetR/AcrR family transcriptional regulator n=1 Tax=Nocardia xishanensis TaxID=238964 RepID=UPI000837609B|nr:TetR/AcrR family transcriptional regulator [Nocardia xishanensis]